jgi:hypothetical protein
LLGHSALIANACREASESEVVVAAVDWEDMRFAGVWIIPTAEVASRVLGLEGSGWSMIFDPGTTKTEAEERALQMARLAFRRWEALQRWSSRHG